MNHVPDEVLAALDAYGEGLLVGSPPPVTGRLRSDLRVFVCRPDGRTAVCRFEIEHAQTPHTLRGYGSFVTTIVDGVDRRLRSWGIDPPDAYEYTHTTGDTHHYEGALDIGPAGR